MRACSRWWHKAAEPPASVTDEVEEWKERNAFAWGNASLPWVGGAGGSILGSRDR